MVSLLRPLFDALDEGDDRYVSIETTRREGDDIVLGLLLHDDGAPGTLVPWQIRCSDVIALAIVEDAHDYPEHFTDPKHPALRPYTDPTNQLFFRGVPPDIPRCIGELWLAHQEAAGSWTSFAKHLQTSEKFLAVGFGAIANGPRFLLDAYALVLARHGVDCSLLEDRPFMVYLDRRWQPLPAPPELLQIGTSTVIAQGFTASR
jgi:hypothetical protein